MRRRSDCYAGINDYCVHALHLLHARLARSSSWRTALTDSAGQFVSANNTPHIAEPSNDLFAGTIPTYKSLVTNEGLLDLAVLVKERHQGLPVSSELGWP